jgi:hypothetical protein
MKTPRQILLESHRATEPQLDRLLEEVLAAEFGSTMLRPSKNRHFAAAILQKLWLELIWPSRRTWAGLAGVWVALAALYLTTQRPADPKLPPANPQMIAAWMQEQQLLAQLLERPAHLAAKIPAPAAPPPTPVKSAEWQAEEKDAWV